MKCSGKQQQYPTEIDRLNKETKDKQFEDLINQAENNKENLKILNEKIDKEFKSHTDSLQFLKNELKKTQSQSYLSWINYRSWTFLNDGCWNPCGRKGGQCNHCNRGKATGYCCRPDGVGGNGDCPPQHILKKFTNEEGHRCFTFNGRI